MIAHANDVRDHYRSALHYTFQGVKRNFVTMHNWHAAGGNGRQAAARQLPPPEAGKTDKLHRNTAGRFPTNRPAVILPKIRPQLLPALLPFRYSRRP